MRKKQALRRLAKATAFALCLSPPIAQAEEAFVCRDDNGNVGILRIDLARKTVVLTSGRSPGRCAETFVDGAYSEPYSAPPGNTCFFVLLGQQPLHQFVNVRGNVVVWGVSNGSETTSNNLDMDSGLMDDGSVCHRAHS